MDKLFFMNEAIEEAKKAYDKGETPIGAVVVKDDQIIGRGHNLTETLKDSTAHAEMLAIREAADTLGGWRLMNCDLYVTMEPCIMCSGAIVNSRIKNIIIGTKHIKNANIEKQHTFKMEYFKDSRVNVEFGIMLLTLYSYRGTIRKKDVLPFRCNYLNYYFQKGQ